MEESIFTKIIKGDIPANKIYEDDNTFAFLDIHPLADGHTLVVPKQQVEFIWDLSEKDYKALMATVQKVGQRLREVINTPYVGIEVIGVDVPHAHVHVVPFTTTSEMRRKVGDEEPNYEKLAQLAEKIRFNDAPGTANTNTSTTNTNTSATTTTTTTSTTNISTTIEK